LLGGRVGPSPFTRTNSVEIFLIETLVLQNGLRFPSDLSNTIYLYREQVVSVNCFEVKYSLYVANVVFRDFIDSFRNALDAQVVVAKIKFQEEFVKLEESGKPIPIAPEIVNLHHMLVASMPT